MKKRTTLKFLAGYVLIAAFTTTSCNNEPDTTAAGTDTTNIVNNQQMAQADVTGTFPDTTVQGTARFEQQPDGQVKMMIDLNVPSKANQSVAVHIHEHGNCGDTAQHAGGHWNPTNENHGRWGEGNFHSGDIGNINLDGQGRGQAEITTDRWSIGGDANKDILGKSIVVHGGVDDFTSQPAGNSGTRIGCGEIRRGGNQNQQ